MTSRSLRWSLLLLPLAANPAPGQALAGLRVVVSPGHGYYWHSSLGWTTQRPLIDGLIEDIHTSEIVRDHLLPYLEGAGARVIMCRARSATAEEQVLDNDQGFPTYQETGSWSTSTLPGFGGGTYRFAAAGPGLPGAATFAFTPATSDLFPVYVAYRAGANRTPQALVQVAHAAGTSLRAVDQTTDSLRWVYVGTFPFRAGEPATVSILADSPAAGIVVADAVKVGDGMGSIVRGGTTSGQLRWRECSRYHAEYFGAPPSVWNPLATGEDNGDDVTCRPFFAEWWGADLFLSVHTNAGGGSGTSTWIYDGGATPGSAAFQSILHSRVVSDLQAFWSPSWVDGGLHQANFGEVRELQTMPGALIELAFHDDIGGDVEAIHHPKFRRIVGRALYRAIATYLAPSMPWVLDPPPSVAVRNSGPGTLTVSWSAVAGATGYRVRLSDDGFAFDDGQQVAGTSLTVAGRPHGSMLFAKVAAVNLGGTGPDGEPAGARVAPGGTAPLLLVNGFDRRDRSLKEHQNPWHWLTVAGPLVASVAAAGYPFDGCSNEAVATLLVPLGGYRCIGWTLGEESTVDESFSSLEQSRITGFLGVGGRLFFSGAEVGWDLDNLGSFGDRFFYELTLGQDYVADDAGTYATQQVVTGPLAPLPAMTFSDGTNGLYDVDFPDVVQPSPTSGGQIVLSYASGGGAAVLHGNGRILGFGFPLEMIVDPDHRRLLVERVLALLCPLPLRPLGPVVPGQALALALDLPAEAGRIYAVAASLGTEGIPLGGGLVLPLTLDPLLLFSIDPAQPVFTATAGVLGMAGEGQAQVLIPADPQLSGFEFRMAAATLDPALFAFTTTTPWIRVAIP